MLTLDKCGATQRRAGDRGPTPHPNQSPHLKHLHQCIMQMGERPRRHLTISSMYGVNAHAGFTTNGSAQITGDVASQPTNGSNVGIDRQTVATQWCAMLTQPKRKRTVRNGPLTITWAVGPTCDTSRTLRKPMPRNGIASRLVPSGGGRTLRKANM